MISAYPLSWPHGASRLSDNVYREHGQFKLTLAAARDDLIKEVDLMCKYQSRDHGLVISSNLELRRDGLPRANPRALDDPGVAVYFTKQRFIGGEPVYTPLAFSCDKFLKVEHNLRAIGKTIEAIRGIQRWGSTEMMDQAFSGFEALPDLSGEAWWNVLDVSQSSSWAEVKVNYTRLRRAAHPDTPGGSDTEFIRIQNAWDEFCAQHDSAAP